MKTTTTKVEKILQNVSRVHHLDKVDSRDHPLITGCPKRELVPLLLPIQRFLSVTQVYFIALEA